MFDQYPLANEVTFKDSVAPIASRSRETIEKRAASGVIRRPSGPNVATIQRVKTIRETNIGSKDFRSTRLRSNLRLTK